MSDVLNEDQVATLVEAAKRGDIPDSEGGRRPRRVTSIDFSRPSKISPEQLRRIERAHEIFCRSTDARLSAAFRSQIELELISGAQLTWAGALEELSPQTVFGIVELRPSGNPLMICAELHVIMGLVESLLGGRGIPAPSRRPLTEIDILLIRHTLHTLLTQLNGAWHELFGLTLDLVEIETQATSLVIATPSEPTLALTIEMRVQGVSSMLSLIVPFRSIEASLATQAAGHFDAGHTEEAKQAAVTIRRALSEVETEVRAEVGAIEMPLHEVLALRPGDMLELKTSVERGIALAVDDVRLHRARAGKSGTWRAAEVIGSLGQS